jgi:hypothetical protein
VIQMLDKSNWGSPSDSLGFISFRNCNQCPS